MTGSTPLDDPVRSGPSSPPVGDELPADAPPPDALAPAFHVYEVRVEDGDLRYYGEPRAAGESLLRQVWPTFREAGYEARLSTDKGEYVLVAEPRSVGIDGFPWKNAVLAVATVLSTLFAGSLWYYADPFSLEIVRALPFTLAVMGVLGVHELGHYAMSRYHGIDATLPYFIPAPPPIGTMGAVIRMRGQMPNRRVLFDIGVAGPLAGLAATVVVTVAGLHMDPVSVPENVVADSSEAIVLHNPPLLELIADAVGQPLTYEAENRAVNPVVVGAWVGMFVTFLNLLPVGQLDGGHVVRAMVGRRQETVAGLVPMVLFGLAAYLHYAADVAGNAVGLWVVWGLFTLVFALVGPATPVYDETLDAPRVAVGAFTFAVGALCFTPVPIEVVPV